MFIGVYIYFLNIVYQTPLHLLCMLGRRDRSASIEINIQLWATYNVHCQNFYSS